MRFCRLKKKGAVVTGAVAGRGWVDDQQRLSYFPALKMNKTDENKTVVVFSECGLKYVDMGLDGLKGY